jgi:hypothetical protein
METAGVGFMRMRQVMVATALALWPMTAQALDCAAPSFVRDYWDYKAWPDTYEVVYGSFSNLRNGRRDVASDALIWDATFTGFRASARAFDQPLLTDVTINYLLFSEIAGGARDPSISGSELEGVEGVIFLQQSATGYIATSGLCRQFIYNDPVDVTAALNCLNGRNCPKE